MIRRLSVALVLMTTLLMAGSAAADNAQPVYLDLEEVGPGSLEVTWKVPSTVDPPAGFGPVLPAGYKAATAVEVVRTADGTVRKWTMAGGPPELAGQVISIRGLDQTAVDGLVRVRLADGTLHRGVLRPTSGEFQIPRSDPKESMGSGNSGGHGILTLWPYALLLVVAWLMSLTARARRRGILLCSAALVAGCLGGKAVGSYAARTGVFATETVSEDEAGKILHGVLLNTYRAFVLEDEEFAYDVLARGVAGEYLQEVYLKNREALRTDAGGEILSMVTQLDIRNIVSLAKEGGGSLAVVAEWDVYGSVLHWDHIHFRCNTYRAEVTLVRSGDYWKISDINVLSEERVI
jgi:hypothetical protein